MLHQGSCHCGAVRFAVRVQLAQGSRCNCSICTKLGLTGAIAKPDALTLLAGEAELSSYAWGSKTAQRYFCRHCGVHCYARGYLDILGGDYIGINVNALDDVELADLPLVHWDGRHDNWHAGPRDRPWTIQSPDKVSAGSR